MASASLVPLSAVAPATDEEAVLVTVCAFLVGLGSRDYTAMLSLVVPTASAASTRLDDPFSMKLCEAIDDIAFGGENPRTRNLEPVVMVDRNVAIVWAPYEAAVPGGLACYGANIISLRRRGGCWLISRITYAGR